MICPAALTRFTGKDIRLVAVTIAVIVGGVPSDTAAGDPFAHRVRLDAAIHIHTQYSTGSDALEKVVGDARRLGVDVIVVTDDDLLKVTFGLPPWRNLLSFSRAHRSLLGDGTLGDYLREIRRLDGIHDDIIVIDGVESAPFYSWEMDLGQRQFTVVGWNKHLLAVGLDSEAAYRQLPILGGEGNFEAQTQWLLLWPVAGILWIFLLRPGPRPLQWGVLIICTLFLADSALSALRLPRFASHDAADEVAAYQTYLDAVAADGGLSFWAHPEAASTVEPLQVLGGLATVSSRTQPHAADLISTTGYTGFASLYADHITATEPGREWDQVLAAYLQGQRREPVWGTGEIDYHEDVIGNRLHDILTVVWAKQRTRASVLAALRAGSAYAVRGGDERLRLVQFFASEAGHTAASGEMLVATGEFEISADLDKVNGTREAIEVRLISGDAQGARVVAHIEGTTPLQIRHIAVLGSETGRYYRLMARTRTSMLTSNPIFVTRQGAQ